MKNFFISLLVSVMVLFTVVAIVHADTSTSTVYGTSSAALSVSADQYDYSIVILGHYFSLDKEKTDLVASKLSDLIKTNENYLPSSVTALTKSISEAVSVDVGKAIDCINAIE